MNDYSVKEIQAKVIEIGTQVAKEFCLPLNSINFFRSEHYGKCTHNGDIYLKIVYPDGELVPLMEVWRTLGHELAHLKYFNHDDAFWEFNRTLVNRISDIIQKKIRPEVAFTRKGVIF